MRIASVALGQASSTERTIIYRIILKILPLVEYFNLILYLYVISFCEKQILHYFATLVSNYQDLRIRHFSY